MVKSNKKPTLYSLYEGTFVHVVMDTDGATKVPVAVAVFSKVYILFYFIKIFNVIW